jgi:hypothetical protein
LLQGLFLFWKDEEVARLVRCLGQLRVCLGRLVGHQLELALGALLELLVRCLGQLRVCLGRLVGHQPELVLGLALLVPLLDQVVLLLLRLGQVKLRLGRLGAH